MMLPESIVRTLYVARCNDNGVQPTQSGARAFSSELGAAAVWPSSDGAGGSKPIRLPGLRLGLRSCEVLVRSVADATAINLHGNPSLGDAGAGLILTLLEHGKVVCLDLGNCSLSAGFAPTLARFLLRSNEAGGALERLQLGGTASGSLQGGNQLHGVAALSAVLQRRCPNLRHLGLSHCGIGRTDEATPCVQALTSLAAHVRSFASLDVSHNALGKSCATLLQLLPAFTSLTHVDLSGNDLSDWGVGMLSDAIGTCETPSQLKAHVAMLPRGASAIATAVSSSHIARSGLGGGGCVLSALYLDGNHIHASGTAHLSRVLTRCKRLRVLSLAENPIGDEGAAAVADAVAECAAAPTAGRAGRKQQQGGIEKLNLSGCRIGGAGVAALGQALRSARVQTLRLARNALSNDDSFEALADALAECPPLRLLDLGGCRVTDRAALAIVAGVVESGGSLGALNLNDNFLTEAGGVQLLQLLSSAAAIRDGGGAKRGGVHSMGVQGNTLSYATATALREACGASRHSQAVDNGVATQLFELSPSIPALELVKHRLAVETAARDVASAELERIEEELAEFRETVSASVSEGEAHAAQRAEAQAKADAELGRLERELATGQEKYEKERATLDDEVNSYIVRRTQLEGLDKSPRRRSLTPTVDVPPLDNEMHALLFQCDEHEKELDALLLRERSAHATRLWAERQMAALEAAIASAKKKGAARGSMRSPRKSVR